MHLQTTVDRIKESWHLLKAQIAQEVPEADAVCEFDCRVEQCTALEWSGCERRVRRTGKWAEEDSAD